MSYTITTTSRACGAVIAVCWLFYCDGMWLCFGNDPFQAFMMGQENTEPWYRASLRPSRREALQIDGSVRQLTSNEI